MTLPAFGLCLFAAGVALILVPSLAQAAKAAASAGASGATRPTAPHAPRIDDFRRATDAHALMVELGLSTIAEDIANEALPKLIKAQSAPETLPFAK